MELQDKKPPKRNKDKGSALERYYKSFFHAVDGIIYAAKYEHNIIIIVCATVVAVILSFLLKINTYEWLFIILICFLIAAMEMINTAIEATIDLITTEVNPLAKIAKDTASAATLLLCISAFIGGLIIFIPKIIALF